MTSYVMPLAVTLVAGWVRVYTAGAPGPVRDARRAEIASDLWEHQHDATLTRLPATAAVREIVSRWLRGVPADVAWRLNVRGDEAMLTKTVVERAAGVLLLLVVGLIVFGLSGNRFGIGADEPYFTNDFPTMARDLAPFGRGLVTMGLAAVALIAAAAGFWVAFQRHEPLLAAAGGVFFSATGVVLLVAVGAGRAVYGLADQWRVSGAYYDATWQAARAAALIFEFLTLATFGLLLVGLLAIGLLTLRRRVLPRWLGALATLSGASAALAFGLAWAGSESSFIVIMTGITLGLVWFVATGIWLVVHGTVERDLAVGSQSA